ncbi:MAG: alpha/beta hydrolase [Myxococcales bacterium]|nr:alpha/beta hydrolase [Myxococcales bacterium]MCB9629909.1 alpha/beta hydrolase [Sandaracinaceae bacterium]
MSSAAPAPARALDASRAPRRRWARRALGLLLGGYALYCGALYAAQPLLFFPGAGPATTLPAPPGVSTLRLTHPDGVETDLWLRAPDPLAHGEGPYPLVVVLHGNGDRIDRGAGPTLDWLNGLGFVAALPEYRGYGRSGGEPSEEAVTADLVRAVDQLTALPEVDAQRVVYFGTSLGTCFAGQLAARRAPAGLLLRTPFLRTDLMALRHYAPPFLVSNPFRNDLALAGFTAPTLIVQHTRDEVAPPEDATALAELLPQATLVAIDALHNGPEDPRERAREDAAVVAFLRAMRSASVDR